MERLVKIVEEQLKPLRWRIACVAMLGLLVTVLLIFFVRSNIGFALAGPLFMVPWCLMCAAMARNPSRISLMFLAFCCLVGFTWPAIVLLA